MSLYWSSRSALSAYCVSGPEKPENTLCRVCAALRTLFSVWFREVSVSQVLPACQTWYDNVWAYFKTLVDVQVEKVSSCPFHSLL